MNTATFNFMWVVCLLGAVCFGMWMNAWTAGIFVLCVLTVLLSGISHISYSLRGPL